MTEWIYFKIVGRSKQKKHFGRFESPKDVRPARMQSFCWQCLVLLTKSSVQASTSPLNWGPQNYRCGITLSETDLKNNKNSFTTSVAKSHKTHTQTHTHTQIVVEVSVLKHMAALAKKPRSIKAGNVDSVLPTDSGKPLMDSGSISAIDRRFCSLAFYGLQ